jgi:hypothetical protein|tara:strand:+ start:219 stop:515 length:297 start_codon:yes stop_codon:yes gene_type:complete
VSKKDVEKVVEFRYQPLEEGWVSTNNAIKRFGSIPNSDIAQHALINEGMPFSVFSKLTELAGLNCVIHSNAPVYKYSKEAKFFDDIQKSHLAGLKAFY